MNMEMIYCASDHFGGVLLKIQICEVPSKDSVSSESDVGRKSVGI